jgi:hypothetical protein
MANTNKYNTDPKTFQKFINRTNKKDSFTRWYRRENGLTPLALSFQKNGSI